MTHADKHNDTYRQYISPPLFKRGVISASTVILKQMIFKNKIWTRTFIFYIYGRQTPLFNRITLSMNCDRHGQLGWQNDWGICKACKTVLCRIRTPFLESISNFVLCFSISFSMEIVLFFHIYFHTHIHSSLYRVLYPLLIFLLNYYLDFL